MTNNSSVTEFNPQTHVVALLRIAADSIGPIGKNKENKLQHYQFRGIDDITPVVNEVFGKLGIVFYPDAVTERIEFQDRMIEKVINGKTERVPDNTPSVHVFVTVVYTFVSALDGSSIQVVALGEGRDIGDKAGNKAMTSALKNALIHLLTISTREANDSEYTSWGNEFGDSSGVCQDEAPKEDPKPRNRTGSSTVAKSQPDTSTMTGRGTADSEKSPLKPPPPAKPKIATMEQIAAKAAEIQKVAGFDDDQVNEFITEELSKLGCPDLDNPVGWITVDHLTHLLNVASGGK